MAVVTVAQVIACAEDFEYMLAEFYANISHQSVREGVKLLTDYMSRHRERTHKALKEMPFKSLNRIYKTPLRYEPAAANCHCFEGVEIGPQATVAEVLDAAMKFDECLISLYRQVLRQDVDREIKDLFESLIRWEEDDEKELKKIKAMDYF